MEECLELKRTPYDLITYLLDRKKEANRNSLLRLLNTILMGVEGTI